MTDICYAERMKEYNTYFIAEGDREGGLRVERLVKGNPTCNCYSVAKVFTVTAIGILYDQGLLTPETRLTELLKADLPDGIDPRWHRVTLHDLMLHRAGFGCGMLDIDVEDASQYPTDDYLAMTLGTRLVHEPGEVSQYTDAAFYLLSRAVFAASGKDLAELLRPILMGTMRFKEFAWSTCPHGYAMGATGLYLRTEDVAKLGILYLREGDWFGTRILSREWVSLVLSRGYELKAVGDGWYAKGGMRGQQLMLHPARGVTLACHSYDDRVDRHRLMAE